MKFVILCALVTQAFTVNIPQSPQFSVPEVEVPQLGVLPVGFPQVGDVPNAIKSAKLPSPQQLPAHTKQQINQHIDHIIEHVKVHRVPQTVLAEHLAKDQKNKQQVVPQSADKEKVLLIPEVPGNLNITIGHGKDPQQISALTDKLQQHVQQISQQAQQHIPQVINQALQKKGPTKEMVSEKVAAPVAAVDVPPKVQAVVQQVHQHVPQIIANHKTRAARAVVVPNHVDQIVQQIHQHLPEVINYHVGTLHADQPRKCDFLCNSLNMPICATNGKCWKQFESLCKLSVWNCMRTDKEFQQVDDAQCQDNSHPKCYPGDM